MEARWETIVFIWRGCCHIESDGTWEVKYVAEKEAQTVVEKEGDKVTQKAVDKMAE